MANCVHCGKIIEQQGNRPKLYCSDKCRKAFNRKAGIVNPDIQSGQSVNPDSSTGSTCTSFETLPKDVQEDIDRLTAWCESKGIEDDRQARIDRAIHYQCCVRAG